MPRQRRPKGTGSISLQHGSYWIDATVHGKRLRENANTTDRTVAEKYLRKRIAEVESGRAVPGKATVSQLLDLVLSDQRARQLRDVDGTEWRIEKNIRRLIGTLRADRFGPHQIRLYMEKRLEEKASAATVNRETAIIRRAFTLGTRESPKLVYDAPHFPRLPEADPRSGFIEESDYQRLLALVPDHLKGPLCIGFRYGFRLGEIRQLRWEQINFDAGEIRLGASQTKGKASRTARFYADVREWLEWQKTRRTGDLVFGWGESKALGDRSKTWKSACKAAKLEGLHFHDLRRSAVRNMIRAGIPERVAMSISGHKTRTIFERYNIVSDADMVIATAKLEAYRTAQLNPTNSPTVADKQPIIN